MVIRFRGVISSVVRKMLTCGMFSFDVLKQEKTK